MGVNDAASDTTRTPTSSTLKSNRLLLKLAGGKDASVAAAPTDPFKTNRFLAQFAKQTSGDSNVPTDGAVDPFKTNRFLAKFAATASGDDDGGGGGPRSGKSLWQKAKGVKMLARAKLSAEEAERIRRSKLVPFGHRYICIRWTIAWTINLAAFVLLLAINFVYGVLHKPDVFMVVLAAWGAALVQTFLIVEPAEVLGMVLLPGLANHPLVAQCRAQCKELGFI